MALGNLSQVHIPHQTYHHFLGAGNSDSNLDRLMYSTDAIPEELDLIICNKENPLVESHHDILISELTLPLADNLPDSGGQIVEVPIVPNHYQETVRQLVRLHKNTPRCFLFFLAGCL